MGFLTEDFWYIYGFMTKTIKKNHVKCTDKKVSRHNTLFQDLLSFINEQYEDLKKTIENKIDLKLLIPIYLTKLGT